MNKITVIVSLSNFLTVFLTVFWTVLFLTQTSKAQEQVPVMSQSLQVLELPSDLKFTEEAGVPNVSDSSPWKRRVVIPPNYVFEKDSLKNAPKKSPEKAIVQLRMNPDGTLDESLSFRPEDRLMRYTAFNENGHALKYSTLCWGAKPCITFDHGMCYSMLKEKDLASQKKILLEGTKQMHSQQFLNSDLMLGSRTYSQLSDKSPFQLADRGAWISAAELDEKKFDEIKHLCADVISAPAPDANKIDPKHKAAQHAPVSR